MNMSEITALSRGVSYFQTLIWRYYRAHGRHDLPWRKIKDLYRILVSEVMLQQTQVDRVIPLYRNFIKQFPTAKKLATAPLSEVLKSWQGLGYNRRAKMLREAAQCLVSTPSFVSRFDLDISELEKLPGVGPYTARAVAAFAYNQDVVVIETNIRTAVIHHFFQKKKKVSDAEIEKVLRQVLPKGRAREWYSALMDYGAYLKRSGISHNEKSERYTKQSKFKGSLREVRGAILRVLVVLGISRSGRPNLMERVLITTVEKEIGVDRHEHVIKALYALEAEKLLLKKNGRYALAD